MSRQPFRQLSRNSHTNKNNSQQRENRTRIIDVYYLPMTTTHHLSSSLRTILLCTCVTDMIMCCVSLILTFKTSTEEECRTKYLSVDSWLKIFFLTSLFFFPSLFIAVFGYQYNTAIKMTNTYHFLQYLWTWWGFEFFKCAKNNSSAQSSLFVFTVAFILISGIVRHHYLRDFKRHATEEEQQDNAADAASTDALLGDDNHDNV